MCTEQTLNLFLELQSAKIEHIVGVKHQHLMENWPYIKYILKIPESLKLKPPNFKQVSCMNKLMPHLECGNKTQEHLNNNIYSIFSNWTNHEVANALRKSVCNYAMGEEKELIKQVTSIYLKKKGLTLEQWSQEMRMTEVKGDELGI